MRFEAYRDIEPSKLTEHELQGEIYERFTGDEYNFIQPNDLGTSLHLGWLTVICKMYGLQLAMDFTNIPGQCRLLAITLDQPEPGEYWVRYAQTGENLYITCAWLLLSIMRSNGYSKMKPPRTMRETTP